MSVLTAIDHGACTDPRCTTPTRQTWHMDPADCPHALPVLEVPCARCGAPTPHLARLRVVRDGRSCQIGDVCDACADSFHLWWMAVGS